MAYNEKNLGDGEKIVLTAHQHFIVLIKAAIQWIFLFLCCIGVAIAINTLLPANTDATVKTILSLIALAGGVAAFVLFGVAYVVWQSEEYIITNERVIQTSGIINKREFATTLEKINDIQTSQSLFGRMLGYGEVELLTGSDVGVNKLHYLEDPFEFKKKMLNAKNHIYGDPNMSNGNRNNPMPASQQDAPVYVMPFSNDPRGQGQPMPNQGFPNPMPAPQPSAQQVADTIAQLAKLRDSGVLSEAEFQAKKNELMSRL